MNISIVIPTRNDNYGGNQIEVAWATLNTMSRTFDEILVVDYGSQEPFYPVLKEAVGETLGNVRVITVPREWILQNIGDDQTMSDTVARNIGVRRAKSEYIVSSNIDIIPGPRPIFYNQDFNPGVFYTSPKYMVEQPQVRAWKVSGLAWETIQGMLMDGRGGYYRQALYLEDPWSKVSGCGDFQFGHRDIWYHPEVRGFEEALKFRNYADSNLHKKIIENAKIPVEPGDFFHVFHQSHHQPSNAVWNDAHQCLFGFGKTTNTENWGYPDEQFEENVI